MDSESIEKRCTLPYAVEYAKSGRSTCKQCRGSIADSSIRISARQPSTFFDGMQDNWFHFACFWKKLKFGKDDINESSIRGVDWLKWEDQEKLRQSIAEFKAGPKAVVLASTTATGKILDFSILKFQTAATSRGKCSGCQQLINSGEVKCQYKSKFTHPRCLFSQFKSFDGDFTKIDAWNFITTEQRDIVLEAYEQRKNELSTAVTASSSGPEATPGPEATSSSSEAAPAPIVQISQSDPDEIVCISSSPSPSPTPSTSSVVAIEKEKENNIKRHFETVELDEMEERAKKRKVEIEKKKEERKLKKLKEQADKMWELRKFFSDVTTDHERRVILKENKQVVPSGNDAIIERLVDIALFGAPAPCSKCQNGQLFYSSSFKTYACSGYATEYSKCMFSDKNPVRTPFAMPLEVSRHHDLSNVHFNDLVDRLYRAEDEVVTATDSFKYLGASRFEQDVADEAIDPMNMMTSKNGQVSDMITRQIIKKGTVVDTEFEYAEECHVYRDDEDGLYSATMSFTEILCNKNSYYKMQLLRHDSRESYYLFQSWGRVGTNVGNKNTRNFYDLDSARSEFERVFKEKTKNEWKFRKYFRKYPGSYSYIETDYSEFEVLGKSEILPGSRTALPKPVKEIIMAMFNTNNMKLAMQSFEMDLNKLPLGKLSKNQITSAYKVLSELQDLIAETKTDEAKIYDSTNKFYTIIPHNFGMRSPEPIDSFKKIKQKSDMLDMLSEIQFAYDQVKHGEGVYLNCDPVDTQYRNLKCDLVPLDSNSLDYRNIVDFMKNTQGSTHMTQQQLIDILEVKRHGEQEKFMEQVGNRKLLWHGSGKMNFAGILGQGLRIAPPEAPVSGYMFGKGVYFADMFSKSLFYCRANNNDEAYMLLCEVALGRILELNHAQTIDANYIKKQNKDSVKGMGREYPSSSITHADGYEIPLGKATKSPTAHNLSLLYNEYIVYNTDQIKIKYLLRMNVKSARHIQ
ncbi:unnamed protein product [Caenorhabditis angaria]|uniref:Poly [ADP-ribose] polymerase n=1 Tax=Caenorhabditis angaria TaxID=860376 RepID=A0A9P1I630_9PELO|nr:unnamed protein product [Caenorhabditis angaria]